jgi:hypothetical protein
VQEMHSVHVGRHPVRDGCLGLWLCIMILCQCICHARHGLYEWLLASTWRELTLGPREYRSWSYGAFERVGGKSLAHSVEVLFLIMSDGGDSTRHKISVDDRLSHSQNPNACRVLRRCSVNELMHYVMRYHYVVTDPRKTVPYEKVSPYLVILIRLI